MVNGSFMVEFERGGKTRGYVLVTVWMLVMGCSAFAAQKFDLQGDVVTSNRIASPIVVRLLSGTTVVQQMLADDRGKFKFRKWIPALMSFARNVTATTRRRCRSRLEIQPVL